MVLGGLLKHLRGFGPYQLSRGIIMKDGLRIEIDIHKNPKIKIIEVLAYVDRESKLNPDREYYMDGDEYAIVSIPRSR